MNNKYSSRSAIKAQKQASNPQGAAINASAELFRSIDSSCPGLTAAEAASRIINEEPFALRRSASYRFIEKLYKPSKPEKQA